MSTDSKASVPIFYTEDGYSTFLQNVGKHPPYYTASHPRRQ
jgi:hypothetical protein